MSSIINRAMKYSDVSFCRRTNLQNLASRLALFNRLFCDDENIYSEFSSMVATRHMGQLCT